MKYREILKFSHWATQSYAQYGNLLINIHDFFLIAICYQKREKAFIANLENSCQKLGLGIG